MTPKKCMSIAKSLTNTQHMELEPLCTEVTLQYSVVKGQFTVFDGPWQKLTKMWYVLV